MTIENSEGVFRYTMAMSMVESMLEKGIISVQEYARMELQFCEKYCINFASIFRKNRWI